MNALKNKIKCFVISNSYLIGMTLATIAAAYITFGADVLSWSGR